MHASSPPPGPLSASIFVEALRAHAGLLVAAALIVHAILWTLAPGISEPTPDPKIAAGLAIGREWMLGYPGMPILAPWTLQGVYTIFPSIFLMKALAPVAVALAGWYVFGFARRIVGEQHGALATLAMAGVSPVAFPVGALDSAVIQMPLVAGMVLAFWRAVREGNRAAWLLFGICGALAFYAGIQSLFVLALLLFIAFFTGSGKASFRKFNSQAPAFAAIVIFALIATPRIWWLWQHDFAGLYENPMAGFEHYGVMKSFEAVGGALAGHLGLFLLIAVATPIFVSSRAAVSFARAPLPGFSWVSGVLIAVLPFLAAAIAAVIVGMRLTIDAFASLLLYSGLLAFLFAGETARLCRQRLAAVIAAILLIFPPLAIAAINFTAPWIGRGLITNWPAQDAARIMNESFANRTGKPLAVIIGAPLYASEIALAAKNRPHIFPNADRATAPWIKDNTLREKGAVVFWPVIRGNAAPPTSLTSILPAFIPEAPLSLSWNLPGEVDPVKLGWAIIPPEK